MDSDNPQFFIDENADLNEMTEEVHNQRLNDALARYWAAQAQEMVSINGVKFFSLSPCLI